jgi:menaquinone-dependent protoporphyrinogen oxidase
VAELPFWVFRSGPFGEKPDPSWSEPPKIIKRAERLGVRDHTVFGGRLPLEPSNFMERAMVRDCPADKRDLRDWDEIGAWAAAIGKELSSAASPSLT